MKFTFHICVGTLVLIKFAFSVVIMRPGYTVQGIAVLLFQGHERDKEDTAEASVPSSLQIHVRTA